MNLIKITDLNLPEVLIYQKLRDNAFTLDNSFIADSPKVVNLLLKTPIKIKSLLATPEYYRDFSSLFKNKKNITFFVAEKKLMQTIVGHKLHHGVMMHGIRPKETPLNEMEQEIIMLDSLTKTENVGAIARSAAAIGINSLLVPTSGPHPYGRRALRVSMGYVSKLKIHIYQDLIQTILSLKKQGYKILAAELTPKSISLSKVNPPQKWVLLMGHESQGLSPEILKYCDEIIKIEMREDIKSFNVAIAASIMMYQLKKK